MGFPALATPVAAEAVLVLDLDALFRRLPATARAQVKWTRPRIEEGLERLVREPLDDALLDEVARELIEPVRALGRAVIELLASNRDEFRTSLMEDLRRQEDRLQAFLPEDDSRDTLAWVLGFLRAFFGIALSLVQPEQLAALDDVQVTNATNDREFLSFMRAQAALMAAVEAAKEGVKPDRCAELTDAAFLNLMEFKNVIRGQGLWLSPFPNETSNEHRESLRRYASRLRETLTTDDWKTLDDARMGNLR